MKDKPGPTCLIGGPSITASDLLAQAQALGTFTWDGVRDEASNAFLRKMRPGDVACLFHGGAMERAVVGQLEVASEPRPDATAWDPDSPYYDPESTEDSPKWFCLDVKARPACCCCRARTRDRLTSFQCSSSSRWSASCPSRSCG